jgi:hypothetical protein
MTAKDKVCPVMKVSGENAGSQIIHTIVSAPQTNYTPYVLLTALRFIKASGGAVSVVGA